MSMLEGAVMTLIEVRRQAEKIVDRARREGWITCSSMWTNDPGTKLMLLEVLDFEERMTAHEVKVLMEGLGESAEGQSEQSGS